MNENTKKIGVLSLCSLILLAMVVALTIGSLGGDDNKSPEVSSSQKAVANICETTDHQKTCVKALDGSNSTNPKDLIVVAFQKTIVYINEATEKSVVYHSAETHPKGKAALETCQELTHRATSDLQRSLDKFSGFDIINVDDILMELKIWLSGAFTHQETCLDAFEGVPGESGEKMRKALTTSMEMTSNSLAMVAEIATYLETMGIGGSQKSTRRLLSEEVMGHEIDGLMPEWTDFEVRRLLTASPEQLKPNLIVAKDGSGKYTTINEALKDVPEKSNRTFVMYIKEGVYEEKIWFNSSLTHLMIVGDGPTKTKITGSLNFIDGTGTYQTATVAVQADDFIARDIGFENSAGAAKHQAVAVRVSADKVIFYNCQIDGYQDTLYTHTYRQFYRDCTISGTIDFIFGDAAAVFQGCTLLVRKPMDNQANIVTAQGRKDIRQPTGLVIQNCTFKADPEYYPVRQTIKSYLARPWKEYSRTIIMESFIDDLIQPEGWLAWNESFALETLFYTEFNNRGPGAPKAQRLKWPGVKELPPSRIQRFTAEPFLDGNRWIPQTRVPFSPGFIFPVPAEDPNIKYSPVAPEETKDLGPPIDKSSYVAKGNDTTPPPPPPMPVAPVAAPEIAIPMDVLPVAPAPATGSSSGSPVAQPSKPVGTSGSPTSSPVVASPPVAQPSKPVGTSGSPTSSPVVASPPPPVAQPKPEATVGTSGSPTSSPVVASPPVAQPKPEATVGTSGSPPSSPVVGTSAPTADKAGSESTPAVTPKSDSTNAASAPPTKTPAAAPPTATTGESAPSPQPEYSAEADTNVSPAASEDGSEADTSEEHGPHGLLRGLCLLPFPPVECRNGGD